MVDEDALRTETRRKEQLMDQQHPFEHGQFDGGGRRYQPRVARAPDSENQALFVNSEPAPVDARTARKQGQAVYQRQVGTCYAYSSHSPLDRALLRPPFFFALVDAITIPISKQPLVEPPIPPFGSVQLEADVKMKDSMASQAQSDANAAGSMGQTPGRVSLRAQRMERERSQSGQSAPLLSSGVNNFTIGAEYQDMANRAKIVRAREVADFNRDTSAARDRQSSLLARRRFAADVPPSGASSHCSIIPRSSLPLLTYEICGTFDFLFSMFSFLSLVGDRSFSIPFVVYISHRDLPSFFTFLPSLFTCLPSFLRRRWG